MLRVGEETGTLDAQLDSAADVSTPGSSTTSSSGSRRWPSRRSSSSWVWSSGFVAVALVSAMYGVFQNQKKFK